MEYKNKKIKNATKEDFEGIPFKSRLEKLVYKTLLEIGINTQYEPVTYEIFKEFIPTIPFYTKPYKKRKFKNTEVISKYALKDMRKVTSITYTPDFVFEYKNKIIVIEVKGFPNEVFPYKFKLFKALLETFEDKDKYEIWEIFSKRQLLECLTNLEKENDTEKF